MEPIPALSGTQTNGYDKPIKTYAGLTEYAKPFTAISSSIGINKQSMTIHRNIYLTLASLLTAIVHITPGQTIDAGTGPSTPKAPRIVLDLRNREIKVTKGRWQLGPWPVAIGAPGTPTPYGEFKITKKIVNPVYAVTKSGEKIRHAPGPTSPIGDRYLEFHRNDRGVFAIHGTRWPIWVETRAAVSNGCIRMLNKDIRKLFNVVKIGTPLEIQN